MSTFGGCIGSDSARNAIFSFVISAFVGNPFPLNFCERNVMMEMAGPARHWYSCTWIIVLEAVVADMCHFLPSSACCISGYGRVNI